MRKGKNQSVKTDKETMKKIFSLLHPHRGKILLSLFFSLLSVAMTLTLPLLIGRAIDQIVGEGNVDFDKIANIILQSVLLIAATGVANWLLAALNNRITFSITQDMRNAAFAKIERLPLSYLDTHAHGDTVSRITTDVEQFADGLLLGFTSLFTGVLTILGTLIFMLTIDWKITLVVVCLTPLSLFIARFISGRTHAMFVAQTKTRGEQTAQINETISNQKVIHAFCHEKQALREFDEINERLGKFSLRAIFFSSLTNPTTRFVNSTVYAAVALTGALTVISSSGAAVPFTVGSLTALLAYVNQYTKPFNEISGVITEFQSAVASAARTFELLDTQSETPDAEDAAFLTSPEGNVALSDVSFSYVPERPLIEDLNLTVPAGARVAIVGPTGCGKTTLINLLMRFYDVKGGKITVEGTDIRALTRESLRKNYGMVLQDTFLKSGTVRENIAYGKPEATEEEIIAAAKASHAHSFIKRLPKGYDTEIGEDGGNLSAGQKQLLCITRVMLTLPPMLILDEATSSIDTRTEIRIQKAFAEMMRGRTSFIVAHRLSTVREADVILVMKSGHIIEQGTHDELMEKGGFYRHLYDSQFAH